jgi:translation initiation factor 1 (eIF-1/SUI1)
LSTDAAPAAAAPVAPVVTKSASAARSGRLVLAREKKHRGGKAVVIVRGFAALSGWDDAAVAALARELKQTLGCGGTVDPGPEIVLQGDRPAQVAEWLRAQGFRVNGVTS